MADDYFDWEKYCDAHKELISRYDILMDPREMYNYVQKPLFVTIEEKLQQIKNKIKNKLTPNNHKK